MNASANTSEREGELKWETGNWGHVSIEETHNIRPSPPNRADWDWNNSMILAQSSGGGSTDDDAIPKSSAPESASSHPRPFSGILSSGFPSNFSQNPVGIFCSSGVTSFRDINITRVTPPPAFHDTLSSPNITGIPGLAPTKGGHGDFGHPFEFGRGQYFGMMDTDHKWHATDLSVKREMDTSGSDGHGSRLGLNLGVRTYFSTEDSGVGRLGKRHRANSLGSQVPMCQAEGCRADLSTAKHYHRRHKVCEIHSKASDVIAAGQTQRFCQQCSRFHVLSEFDEGKRSCRKRLADHNRRRRKPQQTVPIGKATVLEAATQKVDEKNNRISASTGQTSIFIQLQQSGSPSSVSMDDSDDKATSAGNAGVQRLASSGFEQHVMVLNSHGSPDPTPSSRSMLQGIGIPGVPFMFQNAPPQLSVLSGGSQVKTLYQQYFGGVAAQSGTSLSLSSVAEASHGIQRKLSEKGSSGSESFGPWPRSTASEHDVMEADHCPLMHLQLRHLTREKVKAGAQQEINGDHSTAVQVFSESIRNVLPNMNRSPWIANEQTSSSSFDSFGSNVFSVGEQMSGLRCARLGKSAETSQADDAEERCHELFGHCGGQRVDSNTRETGSDVKFLEMQGLGPGSFGPTYL